MKKAFAALVILFIVLYGKVGYELYLDNRNIVSFSQGKLSQIAERVEAISLEDTPIGELQSITKVRSWKDNFFLVSEGVLYRYSGRGEYICGITDPSEMWVAEYLIDPVNDRLIVLGNVEDVWYYSRDGRILDKKRFEKEHPDERLITVAMHDNRIWFVKETVEAGDNDILSLNKKLVEYDNSLVYRNSYSLNPEMGVSLKKNTFSLNHLSLAVREDTGQMYMYAPPLHPDYLLLDTIQFIQNEKQTLLWASSEGGVPVHPFRLGSRFILTASQKAANKNYFYCYDRKLKKVWNLDSGFTDNFYHTGPVNDLQPLDLYNRRYCFTRTRTESSSFLSGKTSAANQTLFVVTLKS